MNTKAALGLSPRAKRVVYAFAEAMFADENDRRELQAASPDVCARAVNWYDESIRLHPHLRANLGLLTLALDWLPILIIGVFSRMTRLSIKKRIQYFEALERSSIGLFSMLLTAFKVPSTIAIFEENPELGTTGFDRPTMTARRKLPVIGGGVST